MGGLTRRGAIGFGILSGSALLAGTGRADDDGVIVADERAVMFKVRDVMIGRVNRDRRTIAARLGEGDGALGMTNLPLAEGITIRVSHVLPGSANNVPFEWDRLEGLVGKRVSMMLRAESGGLSVHSIAVAND